MQIDALLGCDTNPSVDKSKINVISTLVTTAFFILVTFILRTCCDRYLRRNGAPVSQGSPFPSWEIQVFATQVMGISESIGYAIGLSCMEFSVIAYITVAVILCIIIALGYTIWNGIDCYCYFQKCKGTVLSRYLEAYRDPETTYTVMKIYDGLCAACGRGEWKVRVLALKVSISA